MMPSRPATSFLDLVVGPYNLALRTACVLSVLQDVPASTSLSFRGRRLPCVHLSDLLADRPQASMAFVVAIETRHAWVAVGVDDIDHLQRGDVPTLVRLPGFGLAHPTLFEGALRFSDRLLLVLEPMALSELVQARHAQFLPDPIPDDTIKV